MNFKRPLKTLGALGMAAAFGMAGALALAAPAGAEETTTIYLKDAHKGQTAVSEEFPSDLCGEQHQIPDSKPGDHDGWVFILPDGAGDAFVSVTATFEDELGEQHVLEAEIVTTGNSGNMKHAYVGTPMGWTLVDAEAEVDVPGKKAEFNVTHTCPGEKTPDEETTPPGETPSPTDDVTSPGEETTMPGEEGSTAPGEESTSPASEGLPQTGAPLTIALVSAAALAAAGGALFFVMRRRAAETW